ncbi:MAG: lipoprotein insertase outer membrane protein LolB [Hylemonella sp.]|uniref:lipoprotein insertase outer membrane protein LolB n=1 Tax=Hylemonella sp. TaxID=2066020 RepID=UPI0022C31270|nr:lipoprotein insertase outer membrane protein LolB [Hylemonella sp.]MCZ8252383.1 lipoprotein insertase outer membrane protein LolB [Hylemonella sp.]
MSPHRRRLNAALASLATLWLAGCAQPVLRTQDASRGYWRGRLALRIDALPEPTSFFANFELSGAADAGELLLSSPIGTTLAQLRWSPQSALLRNNGQTRAFDSLDALAVEATGTAIPIAALFEWLQGRDALADGWQADLTQLPAGRLLARRAQPTPVAELRLILEP